MLELKANQLIFTFPEVHPQARLAVDFQRTLRIPDDGSAYALPPGLGRFPLRHVDDFAAAVPPGWLEHGGVMLPMYQAEALWISFQGTFVPDRVASYPFAVKVAAGKVSRDLQEIIRRRPRLFAQLIRDLKDTPDHAVLRLVREVRDGKW